ncbi:MAG: flagellar motor protein MotB [Pseudomonadota bacterium]
MAKAAEPIRPVIVKKITIAGHGGHHGGAWKVAYADFVTAMMAFFLLMWLLGATTEKQRKGLADYFAPTLVAQRTDSAGGNGLLGGDSIVSTDRYPHRGGQTGTRTLTIPRDAKGGEKEASGPGGEKGQYEKIKSALAQKLKNDPALRRFARNIRFTETREGLRIDMVDEADFTMFASGTDQFTLEAAQLLGRVSEVIAETPNGLIIRGHTDAMPYNKSTGMNNWQLSVSRAEATRLSLLRNGVGGGRINRIEGVADREPYIPGDPLDSRNRRMSITLGRLYTDSMSQNFDSQKNK